jgi:fatty-acyl-CoA synthase
MTAVVPTDDFEPAEFLTWLGEQPDCSPQWVPRFLRVIADPPRTSTGKVVVRALAADRWNAPNVWLRDGDDMRPMTRADVASLQQAFAASGRALI